MSDQPFPIRQEIFTASHPHIHIVPVHENELQTATLDAFMRTVPGDSVGVAAAYASKCRMGAIAFASPTQVLVVRLSTKDAKHKGKGKGKKATTPVSPGRELLRTSLLCNRAIRKIGFGLDRVSTSLYFDLDLRITGGYDVLFSRDVARRSFDEVINALGGTQKIVRDKLARLFRDEQYDPQVLPPVALRAWAAYHAGKVPSVQKAFAKALQVDTEALPEEELAVLSKVRRDADRLDALKPTKVKNDVAPEFSQKSGYLNLQSARFKTRIRRSVTQEILVEVHNKGQRVQFNGRSRKVEGRAATVSLKGDLGSNKIRGVYTIGKEEATNAEELRTQVVMKALVQSITLVQNPFFQSIWLPHRLPDAVKSSKKPKPIAVTFPARPLNPSQRTAVEAILSEDPERRISLIKGPPGTGKTTVISASVISMMADSNKKRYVWLVAQSNVAVKNIAEKLADFDFLDFKLLVSHDFHFDWHEHLYTKIEANVIRSDDFTPDLVGAERKLGGSRVILCTLSMLANGRIAPFTRAVPVQVAIVDEASQIEIGDYLPLLSRFEPTLLKLACIGDDKQLPPYGQEDVRELQSVFEVPHLSKGQVFLDTQYRMPRPIGNFISKHVYNGRLKTEHEISAVSSCRFVDVGGEEKEAGYSWVNVKEIQAVIHIARKFQNEGKPFRIVTPYDSQRSRLEDALKVAGLHWEDKCFCVDSFQGNEEEHIILSVVRSKKAGFLSNSRRTNVMLSRCKKSMIICTNRTFVQEIAPDTLVGKLAAQWGDAGWLSWQDVIMGRI